VTYLGDLGIDGRVKTEEPFRIQWRALVNTVKDLLFPYEQGLSGYQLLKEDPAA
jgi:hypothetical protein